MYKATTAKIQAALTRSPPISVRRLSAGGDNLVKDVQCYELFGGIALQNHAF